MRCQIRLLLASIVERIEVIDDRNSPTVGEQRIDDMAADETRPSGYQGMSNVFQRLLQFIAPLRLRLEYVNFTVTTGKCTPAGSLPGW